MNQFHHPRDGEPLRGNPDIICMAGVINSMYRFVPEQR